MSTQYKHWRNFLSPGTTFFVTTKCLDFAQLFLDTHLRDLVAACLMDDCLRMAAVLHGYVVMPHHVHFLATALPEVDPHSFVRRFKSNSARRLGPLLDAGRAVFLDAQKGLNRRSFWESGFRGVEVFTSEVFDQKMNYIHGNPMRSSLCRSPEEYLWCSEWAYAQGLAVDRGVLDCGRLRDHYAPGGLPGLGSRA
jgi:putative transposase